jgi:hypothetical protein
MSLQDTITISRPQWQCEFERTTNQHDGVFAATKGGVQWHRDLHHAHPLLYHLHLGIKIPGKVDQR